MDRHAETAQKFYLEPLATFLGVPAIPGLEQGELISAKRPTHGDPAWNLGITTTLTGGTWPTWIGDTTAGTGDAALNVAGSFYTVDSRTSGTVIELTTSNTFSAASYVALQSEEDDPEATFQDIDDVIQDGYLRTLRNPMGHEWTFLRKTGTLSVADTTLNTLLPDGFGGKLHSVNYDTQATGKVKLREIGIDELFAIRANETAADSHPRYFAWRPLETFASGTGQRYEILVHPESSGGHTLRIEYRHNPDKLTPANNHCVGGMEHSQLVLAAVLLTAAEKYELDSLPIWTQRYQQRLQAAILADSPTAAVNEHLSKLRQMEYARA